jgi:type VI protein secretion system component VasF
MVQRFFILMRTALYLARSEEGLSLPPDEIRRRLETPLAEERRLPLPPIPPGGRSLDMETCRFAVYAWIDETLLNSPRPDAGDWSGHSLQYQFFHTAEGGARFYDNLLRLLRGLDPNPELERLPELLEKANETFSDGPERGELSVYALCLLYGFSGRLFNRPDMLTRLRETARPLLEENWPPAAVQASNGANSTTRDREWRSPSLLSRVEPVLLTLLPLVVTALFLLYCAGILADALPQSILLGNGVGG